MIVEGFVFKDFPFVFETRELVGIASFPLREVKIEKYEEKDEAEE